MEGNFLSSFSFINYYCLFFLRKFQYIEIVKVSDNLKKLFQNPLNSKPDATFKNIFIGLKHIYGKVHKSWVYDLINFHQLNTPMLPVPDYKTKHDQHPRSPLGPFYFLLYENNHTLISDTINSFCLLLDFYKWNQRVVIWLLLLHIVYHIHPNCTVPKLLID